MTMEKVLDKPRRTLMDTCSLCREKKNQYIDFCSQASKTEETLSPSIDQSPKEPKKTQDSKSSVSCKDCRKKITEMLKSYSKDWKKHEEKHHEIRSQLNLKVSGYEKAIVTQENTPVGSMLEMDGQKQRTAKVTLGHFNTFLKTNPFANKTYERCAVVGNAGILTNSTCGKTIDSADFVIRCNLPPLTNEYKEDVGVKTNLVSANPSILHQKYGSLLGSRRAFMEKLCQYGDSMLLLPAFSYSGNIAVCMRASHTVKDFGSPMEPIYFSPQYLKDLDTFWRSQGWKAVRLSTGMILTSMALELCDDLHLYGFWPFELHPETFKELTNHYYDDLRPKRGFHAMPEEFKLLLHLHNQGVLKLHIGDCPPSEE
ncbi:alpha-2,8-sialyltransferase 8F-like [Fundulus diaphanus]